MNIFFTDLKPDIAAQNLHDIHLRKMILETAQMLSTAHHVLDHEYSTTSREYFHYQLYKPTHKNHPMSIWVRERSGNYLWALAHLCALCKEFEYRFNKPHKTSELIPALNNLPLTMHIGNMTLPPMCFPDHYKYDGLTVVDCYRLYYMSEKLEFTMRGKQVVAEWTKRNKPDWITKHDNNKRYQANS